MPKKAHLANHYQSDELKRKYLKSQDPVESRRWHLIWKVSLGWTVKNAAIAIGVSYTYGKEIVARSNQYRTRNGNRKSLESKRMGLLKKVKVLLSESETKT